MSAPPSPVVVASSPPQPPAAIPSTSVVKQVWVHLDLKGSPPTVSYLLALLPQLRAWGATGLLVEWEDMLPFSPPLGVVAHDFAYTRDEVAAILAAAATCSLEVVPLVQTFGHMEFVLKHDRFAHLREDAANCMDLCPLHPDAMKLVTTLIDQVLALHPGVRRLHVGCDEVFGISTCGKCRMKEATVGSEALFVDHVMAVCRLCVERGVRPFIWHDMIETYPTHAIAPLAAIADCVVWNYGPNIEDHLPSSMWASLPAAGFKLWGASAFKGASQPSAVWTPLPVHLSNHASWAHRAKATPLEGMVVTGWSRFNHTAALCEVLPVAIPSLALGMAVLQAGHVTNTLVDAVLSRLGLAGWSLSPPVSALMDAPVPSFPGGAAFRALAVLESARQQLARTEENVKLFCPPGTHQINPGLWRRLEGSAHSAATLAAAVRASVASALEGVLKPYAVEEVVRCKVDVLVDEATALANKVARLPAQYGAGSGHRPHRVLPEALAAPVAVGAGAGVVASSPAASLPPPAPPEVPPPVVAATPPPLAMVDPAGHAMGPRVSTPSPVPDVDVDGSPEQDVMSDGVVAR